MISELVAKNFYLRSSTLSQTEKKLYYHSLRWTLKLILSNQKLYSKTSVDIRFKKAQLDHESKNILIISTIMVFIEKNTQNNIILLPRKRKKNIYKSSNLKRSLVSSMTNSLFLTSKANLIVMIGLFKGLPAADSSKSDFLSKTC